MDPLTALGLAANILQFVSVGHKLLSAAQEIGASSRGTMKEVDQHMALVADIRRKIKTQTLPAISDVSDEDKHVLGNVAQECQDVAGTLMEKLSKLKATNRTGLRGKLEAVFVAGKYMWKKDEISGLKNRLFELESRLERWWESEQSLERNTSIQAKIDSLAHSLGRLEAQSPNDQLKVLSSDLQSGFDALKGQARRYEELIQANSKRTTEVLQKLRDEINASHESTLLDTMAMLESLAQEIESVEKHETMIQSLSYSSIKTRQSNIPDAQLGTLQWLFDPGTSTFSQWLEEGQGVFWVNGLAGSGKSTLMKFATSHLRTHRHLQIWAQPSKLVTASHYFWTAGTAMQKSQQGLLQNILHQLFRASPSLVDILCPDRPASDEWDMDELRAAFAKLGRQTGLDTKFSLFIDGLDEFGGPEEDIIQIVKGLAESQHIKVCVSSRRWPAFMAEWETSDYTLEVHKFTKDDMDKYIRDLLAENNKYGQLSKQDDRYHNLVEAISQRAEGVWLWVYLVVRDLLRDMRDNEPYDQLLVRLNSYPQELEDYFRNIFSRIDPIYQGEAARIFLVRLSNGLPISILALSYLLGSEDLNLAARALNAPVGPISIDEMEALHQEWVPRLQNRCQDLLKITATPQPEGDLPWTMDPRDYELQQPSHRYTVDFLHATVHDFLEQKLYQHLIDLSPVGFDKKVFIVYFNLILMKHAPWSEDRVGMSNVFVHVEELFMQSRFVHEAFTTEAGIALADEVDRTVFHINAQGANLAEDLIHEFLLGCAVRCDTSWYVKLRIGQDSSRIEILGALLLDYSLQTEATESKRRDMYGHRFAYNDRSSERVFGLLLEYGIDPNKPISGRISKQETMSSWELYVRTVLDRLQDPDEAPDETIQLYDWHLVRPSMQSFLEQGADPDLQITKPSGEKATIMDYLKERLCPATLAEIGALLDLARKKKLGEGAGAESIPEEQGSTIQAASQDDWRTVSSMMRLMELLTRTLPGVLTAMLMAVWMLLPLGKRKEK